MKQPDIVTFFIDRALGKHAVASALRVAGARIELHDEHFAPDARDEDWLIEVGRRGWAVLTKDKRFHNRVLELTAIARSQARVFKLTAGTLQGPEMAAIFVKALKKMQRICISNPAPFIAIVTRNGRTAIILNASKLKKYR